MRLLVVEDSEKLASLMKKLLSDNGFAVDCVETAEEAISAFELAEYDIIVLDLSLLDGDGTEFLKWLRKARHSTPVLVATARADVTQRVQLFAPARCARKKFMSDSTAFKLRLRGKSLTWVITSN